MSESSFCVKWKLNLTLNYSQVNHENQHRKFRTQQIINFGVHINFRWNVHFCIPPPLYIYMVIYVDVFLSYTS